MADKIINSSFWGEVWSDNAKLVYELEKVNSKPVFTVKSNEDLALYYEFCAKTSYIKSKFLSDFIKTNDFIPYDETIVNSVLEPLIPQCSFDEKTEVFHMKLDFVPFLKFNSVKEFSKVKNVILRLITEGINRMEKKPHYGKNAVLIIFTMYSPYVFDVDNIEFKYMIDAFRYSGFFYDDSYKYVSYMVEGKENKTHPLIEIKILKKDQIFNVNLP